LSKYPVLTALICFLLPALSLYCFYSIYLSVPNPTFVYAYGDPDYGYLFNALLIADGQSPWHIDHPGTPVQLLGAFLMLLRYWLMGTESSLSSDFFAHSLLYHRTMVLFAFGGFFWSQWFCGWRLIRQKVSVPIALLAQATPFFFFDTVEYFPHWSPETWIASFSLLLIPVLWAPELKESSKQAANRAIAVGALIAVILSLKLYSLPLVLLIFVLPGFREWLIAAAALLFTFLNLTAVIWLEYPRMFRWLLQLATHQGNYGTGPQGMPGPLQWIANAAFLYKEELYGLLILLAAAIPVFALWARRKDRSRLGPELLAALFMLALALRHNPVPRYLIPLTAPLGVFFLRATLLPLLPRLAFALAGLMLVGAHFPRNLQRVVMGRLEIHNQAIALQDELSAKYEDCALLFLDAAPVEPFTLFSGHLATRLATYQEQLNEHFPRFFFPSVGNSYRNYSHLLWTKAEFEKVLKKFPCRVYVFDDSEASLLAVNNKPDLPPSPTPPYRLGKTHVMLLYLDTRN